MQGPPETPLSFNCPHCREALEAAAAEGPQTARCPHCGGTFSWVVASGPDGSPAVFVNAPQQVQTEEAESRPDEASRQDDLDGARILQISKLRRSAYRSRSYCIIGAILCAVAAVKLGINCVKLVWNVGWSGWLALHILAVAVCATFATRLYAKSREYAREAAQSALEEPTKPPDFSTLGDGSQSWKSLEEMHGKE